MGVTIKDVAKSAGVSIATVSHVMNGTRFVRPELVKRVELAIRESGYQLKAQKELSGMQVGIKSMIAIVIPGVSGSLFAKIITLISQKCEENGYIPAVYLTHDNFNAEKRIFENLVNDKKIAGIMAAPVSKDSRNLKVILKRGIPMVCIERTVDEVSVSCVSAGSKNIIYKGTQTLLNSGHTQIGMILSNKDISTVNEQLTGFLDAMYDAGVHSSDSNIVKVNLYDTKNCKQEIINHYETYKPTAYIAGGNRITFLLISTLQQLALEIPGDISVIGYGDEAWCSIVGTPLTTFSHDCEKMSDTAMLLLLGQINGDRNPVQVQIPSLLEIRRSIKMIGKGPYGESTVSPSNLDLTPVEIRELQEHHFRVGVSFHYGNTMWAAMHEKGLRYILSRCGVSIVAVTDSNFDAALQAIQLESLRMQGVDAIVAIPVDDNASADKFKQLSKETKLIFISNIPDGFNREDYYSLVSTNERENGRNGAVLLGEYFKKENEVVVGFLVHGSKFLGTYLRDMIAEQTIREEYPHITIVESEPFYQIERTYQVAKNMIQNHPEIRGLYISWEGPALGCIRAMRELGRMDIKIVTFDLDYEIAGILANESCLLGLSAQKAYEQGIAAGQATAKALLGQRGYEYIGISPCIVERHNLLPAWKEVMHENAPEELAKIFKNNM